MGEKLEYLYKKINTLQSCLDILFRYSKDGLNLF